LELDGTDMRREPIEVRKTVFQHACRMDLEGIVSIFQNLRRRQNEVSAFLFAFDLLELDDTDMRREPIEVRKATLASILCKSRNGMRLNGHLEHDCGLTVFQHAGS
jgi:hypothetical protein